jgi:hypothetical protein
MFTPCMSGGLWKFFGIFFLCRSEWPSLSIIQHRWTKPVQNCRLSFNNFHLPAVQLSSWVSLRVDFCFLVFWPTNNVLLQWKSWHLFWHKMRNLSHLNQHEQTHQCCSSVHTCISSDYITGERPKNSDSVAGREKKFDYSPQSAARLWGTNNFLYSGYRGPLSEVKRPGREFDHPAVVGPERKIRGALCLLSLTPVALHVSSSARKLCLCLDCYLYCSAVIPDLDIANAVILQVTGTYCLNDKWRGSYTTL